MNVLLVDDHTIVREGLRRVLGASGEGWAITEEASGARAIERLRLAAFDVAVVDLSMPGMHGLKLIERMRDEFPAVPILVLSMHAEEEYAMRAFKAGAKGYVTKDSPAGQLLAAVHKVARGGIYVSAGLAEIVVQQINDGGDLPLHQRLTNREYEVLRRIVAGQRSTVIAVALHLSAKTVSTHKTHILEKLSLTSTAALIRYGMDHGLSVSVEPAQQTSPA